MTWPRYCGRLAEHLGWVGSRAVRDQASLGGNLALRHANPAFPSDPAVLLAAVGARLETVWWEEGTRRSSNLATADWLEATMDKRLLLAIHLPPLAPTATLLTCKVAPRAAGAHALVSCALLLSLEGGALLARPALCYTGLGPSTLHATHTEELLGSRVGSRLEEVVAEAVAKVGEEVQPEEEVGAPGVMYRRGLAQGLLYKCLLRALGEEAREEVRSGGEELRAGRGVSRGVQQYGTDETLYPVSEPVVKVEAPLQTAGQAPYADDTPRAAGELAAALVLSTVAAATLGTIDAAAALARPGVVAFYDHTAIGGTNNLVPGKRFPQEVFASTRVSHAGQVLGIIVAEDTETAHAAARLVKVLEVGGVMPCCR